jgi:hypothetical protein
VRPIGRDATRARSNSERESPHRPPHSKSVPLHGAQGLLDIGNQIVRVLDADRKPDRGVEDPNFLPDLGRHSRMGHARGEAGEGLRPTQAHGQLEDLKRVEELERGSLPEAKEGST